MKYNGRPDRRLSSREYKTHSMGSKELSQQLKSFTHVAHWVSQCNALRLVKAIPMKDISARGRGISTSKRQDTKANGTKGREPKAKGQGTGTYG